jgi:hypothetical protein
LSGGHPADAQILSYLAPVDQGASEVEGDRVVPEVSVLLPCGVAYPIFVFKERSLFRGGLIDDVEPRRLVDDVEEEEDGGVEDEENEGERARRRETRRQ